MKTKSTFLTMALIGFFATAVIAQSDAKQSRNYADYVINSSGVINPQNAVDNNRSNYAVLRTDIGVLNFSSIKVGFNDPGFGGQRVEVEVQNDNGLLTADVLQSISVTVYDSHDNNIAQRNGFDVTEAHVIKGTSHYRLTIRPKSTVLNIASVKITVSGLASVENRLRLYNVWIASNCPVSRGDILHAFRNVNAPKNAITVDKNDYALLTPPLLAGNSYLDIAFSQPGTAGRNVRFNLGEGNTLLDATLLQHITLTVFDTNGDVVSRKSDFQLVDAEVLPGGRFYLTISTPVGNYQIGRARITFTGLVNVLTTLKVYGTVTPLDCASPSPITQDDEAVSKPVASSASSIDLQVNPNPFNAYTTLNIKSKLTGTAYVVISGATGSVIEKHQIYNTASLHLLESAPAGVYFIKVISGNLVETRKVIKM